MAVNRRQWLAGAERALAVLVPLLVASLFGRGWAAVGGGSSSNTTFTTSTTHHATYTRVQLPDLQAFVTRVLGEFAGISVYDQSFNVAFPDPAVQLAVVNASLAIQLAAGHPVAVSSPTLVALAATRTTTNVSVTVDHTTQTVTSTHVFGPQTILIGDDQSQTFFVQSGTDNINTNTHTETFDQQPA